MYEDRYDLTIAHSRVKLINGATGKASVYSYCVWPEPRLNGSRFYADRAAKKQLTAWLEHAMPAFKQR